MLITQFSNCVQGGGKRLRVPEKSSRKKLNQQASMDSSIDQWKTFNMSASDLQVTDLNTVMRMTSRNNCVLHL